MKIFVILGLMLISVSLHAQLADFRHVRFNKADSIASENFNASLLDIPALSTRLTRSLTTEEEKFRAIFKWVCSNIEFDMELFRLNQNKRNKSGSDEALLAWNKKIMPVVYRNLVVDKKTVCTGYAWLLQELARHAGIVCVIVDGYGRHATANIRRADKANHSWNAVKLNGKWYLCDPTWASGVYDRDGDFIRQYDNAYFLADPKVFVRNHYPLDQRWTLLEGGGSKMEVKNSTLAASSNVEHNSASIALLENTDQSVTESRPSLAEFLNGPLIYSSAYRYNLTQLYPATFDITTTKDEPVGFKFASTQPLDQLELSLNKDQKVISAHPEFSVNADGLYSFSHTFSEKGRHVLHVRVNGSYVFTYAVTVK